MNPVAYGVGRSVNRPDAAATADVAEIPVSHALRGRRAVVEVGVEPVGAVIGIQDEGGLARRHGGVGPEFHGDFVGGNDVPEIGDDDVLVGAVEDDGIAKRCLRPRRRREQHEGEREAEGLERFHGI